MKKARYPFPEVVVTTSTEVVDMRSWSRYLIDSILRLERENLEKRDPGAPEEGE